MAWADDNLWGDPDDFDIPDEPLFTAPRRGIWTDAQGTEHRIYDMPYDYLINVQNWLRKSDQMLVGKKLAEIEREIVRRELVRLRLAERAYGGGPRQLRKGTKTMLLYVAVIVKKGEESSSRAKGDWACFTRPKKEDAVKEAMAAIRDWDPKNEQDYHILVGLLGEEVKPLSQFQLVSIVKAQNARKTKSR